MEKAVLKEYNGSHGAYQSEHDVTITKDGVDVRIQFTRTVGCKEDSRGIVDVVTSRMADAFGFTKIIEELKAKVFNLRKRTADLSNKNSQLECENTYLKSKLLVLEEKSFCVDRTTRRSAGFCERHSGTFWTPEGCTKPHVDSIIYQHRNIKDSAYNLLFEEIKKLKKEIEEIKKRQYLPWFFGRK